MNIKSTVLNQQNIIISTGTTISLDDDIRNYDYIVIVAWCKTSSGGSRGFRIVTIKYTCQSDAGKNYVYLNGGIYYNASYNACIGLTISSDGKSLNVAECNLVGYTSMFVGRILGFNLYK